MKKNHLLLFLSGIPLFCFSQTAHLSSINKYLIGPENVNTYFEEQVSYYQNKYEVFRDEIDEVIEQKVDAQLDLEIKVRKNTWEEGKLASLGRKIERLEEQKLLIDEYIDLWLE